MTRHSRNRAYMTPNEVAELLMVSPVTIRQWAQKGRLKATTTAGGHRRFLKTDVKQFAREHGMQLVTDGPLRVLVVDDNHASARSLAEMVASFSVPIVISIAYDSYDAGRKIALSNPDIVLLDLMMPGMDGFSVCKQLKQDANTQQVRIIAMTALYTPENKEKILNAGAEVCLVKPITKSMLLSVMGADLDDEADMQGSAAL